MNQSHYPYAEFSHTYYTTHTHREDEMKRSLKARIEVARFLQDAMNDMAHQVFLLYLFFFYRVCVYTCVLYLNSHIEAVRFLQDAINHMTPQSFFPPVLLLFIFSPRVCVCTCVLSLKACTQVARCPPLRVCVCWCVCVRCPSTRVSS